ncbi:MAG: pyridoxal-phosphate dependent enzyme [Chloroflexales bacterium]|nr:pyridoxal-phosphate dependent enzyme [Chloroflexales bacterium]
MEDIVSFADVQRAAERLAGVAHRTPVMVSRTLDALTGRSVFLKCENFQRGGAFKFRGAYNAISRLLERDDAPGGVAAFSSGNHAQGVALAAQLLGVPAVICMPTDAPLVKLAATRGYGAEVLLYDRHTTDREVFAREVAAERDLALIPPYDHPDIIAGQGTTALELLEEVPELDTLVAPVGGGGLIAGCAIAAHSLNPQLAVYGVEAEDADDTLRSLRAGERVSIPPPRTVADGMRPQTPGALTFPINQRHLADVLIVSDDEILQAAAFCLQRLKLVVEPTGAVPLAAVLNSRLPANARRVGVILSGGNIDPSVLARLPL